MLAVGWVEASLRFSLLEVGILVMLDGRSWIGEGGLSIFLTDGKYGV
jgi:hypothetical protein